MATTLPPGPPTPPQRSANDVLADIHRAIVAQTEVQEKTRKGLSDLRSKVNFIAVCAAVVALLSLLILLFGFVITDK